MLKFYRYILLKCKERVTYYFTKPSVPTEPIDELYRLVVAKKAKKANVNLGVATRCSTFITVKTRNITPILQLLAELVTKAQRDKDKYLNVPLWFMDESERVRYDDYMTVNNNFISEEELITELYRQLTTLNYELERKHNVKFKNYYKTKMSKLYNELIFIVNQF